MGPEALERRRRDFQVFVDVTPDGPERDMFQAVVDDAERQLMQLGHGSPSEALDEAGPSLGAMAAKAEADHQFEGCSEPQMRFRPRRTPDE